MARYAIAKVVTTSPLTVAFQGDPPGVAVPAIDTTSSVGLSFPLAIDDLVRVQILSPLVPQVVGRPVF